MTSWERIARRTRVPLGFVFAILYFVLARPTIGALAAGAVVVVAGLSVRAAASGHVRKNEELTTTGPYAYTRNPLYLGSTLMALGFAIAGRNGWIGGALVVFFLAIYLPVIRSEETFLRGRFAEFAEYEKNVPRLVPRVTAWRKADGAFSWALYRQHREYNALTGAAVLMMALLVKMWLRQR
jgi:protein-S-isoprenylcysteine O-methyltransferase Ste14